MHFFVSQLLSIAIITKTYYRNLRPSRLKQTSNELAELLLTQQIK